MYNLRDISTPYKTLEHSGIEYNVCKDFEHISRYRGLRQVAHNPTDIHERFIALETVNYHNSNVDVFYYEVSPNEENRLDVIAHKCLGSATYGWIIAYFNDIEDGFTVSSGQRLRIPKQFTSLFKSGEVLQPINPLALNLGSE